MAKTNSGGKIGRQNFTERLFSCRWKLLLGLLTVLVVCYTYSDLLILARLSMCSLTDIVTGQPLALYSQRQAIRTGNDYWTDMQEVGSGYMSLLPLMVWCLPVWLLEFFGDVDVMNNLLCLIWIKGFLAFMLWLCLREFRALAECMHWTEEKTDRATYAFLSGALLVNSLIVAHIYAFYLWLILKAVTCFCKKKEWLFLLFAAIAVYYNPVSLFVILFLLVIRNKNIFVLLGKTVLCMLPWAINTVISGMLPLFQSRSVLEGEFTSMLSKGISAAGGTAPLVLLWLGGWIVAAYFREDENSRPERCLQYCFISLSGFLVLSKTNPYWSLLITPFFALTLYMEEDDAARRFLLVLESVFAACLMMVYMLQNPWCYSQANIAPMLLGLAGKVGGAGDVVVESFWLKLQKTKLFIDLPISALVLSWGTYLLYSNPIYTPKAPKNAERLPSEKAILLLRFGFNALISLTPLVLFLLLSVLRGS